MRSGLLLHFGRGGKTARIDPVFAEYYNEFEEQVQSNRAQLE